VAVRAAPTHQSEFLTSLPFGVDIEATGSCGDFLQFHLGDVAGTLAYVPLIFQGVHLYVPSPARAEGDRVGDLERRVELQDRVIESLQAELSALRAHMTAIATAFGAFSPKQ